MRKTRYKKTLLLLVMRLPNTSQCPYLFFVAARRQGGKTALACALASGRQDIAALLMAFGARPSFSFMRYHCWFSHSRSSMGGGIDNGKDVHQ